MPQSSRTSIKPLASKQPLRVETGKKGKSQSTPRKAGLNSHRSSPGQTSHRSKAFKEDSFSSGSVAASPPAATAPDPPVASAAAPSSEPEAASSASATPARTLSPSPPEGQEGTNEWQTIMDMRAKIDALEAEAEAAKLKHASELAATEAALAEVRQELEAAHSKIAAAEELPSIQEEESAPEPAAAAEPEPEGLAQQLEAAQEQLKGARAEVARLHQENEAKDKLLNDSKSTIKKHEQDLTLAVAQEALRGIQMMEKMEKSIEERKGREVGLMGKLKMAMKETVANKEWEEKLAEVEAEAQEREKRDATEIEELRRLLNERQEHAHAADDIAAIDVASDGAAAKAPDAAAADGGAAAAAEAEEVEMERKRTSFELMKAKTELELTRMEEKSLAEKLDRSMALVQLQLQASGTLKDLHEARGLVGQTEAIRYFSMSRRDLRPGGGAAVGA